MNQGDRVPPHADTPSAPVETPPPIQGPTTNDLSRATEFLVKSTRLCWLQTNHEKYRSYVTLNRNELYSTLVELYTHFFASEWTTLRRYVEPYTTETIAHQQRFAARNYISGWFIDLYVSNREAVKKLTPLAYNEYYSTDKARHHPEYDNFLTLLSSAIRPTHIMDTPEDTLYIPLIRRQRQLGTENNPFNITDFVYSYPFVCGLIQTLQARKCWKRSPLSDNTMGRATWLFDWHGDKMVAPFPATGNYTKDDVTMAYILGVPCTPLIGCVDVDDWQFIPPNVDINTVNPNTLVRIDDPRFPGAYSVRVIETQEEYYLPISSEGAMEIASRLGRPQRPSKKRKTASASTSKDPTTPASSTMVEYSDDPVDFNAPGSVSKIIVITDYLFCR
uniref:Coat Protein n=1 Tax=Arhar cryptic virus-II TaxID=1587534 RepID=W8XAA0_9VIRU|nr:Coat Protein [Arhar cryptic virus-II]